MGDANLSTEVEDLHEDHAADVLDQKDRTNLPWHVDARSERLAVVNGWSVEDQKKNRLGLRRSYTNLSFCHLKRTRKSWQLCAVAETIPLS